MDGPVLLEVGRIVKPHGLRGEVVVALVTNRPERLAAGSTLHTPTGTVLVRHSRPFEATGDGRWIVAFAGVGDRQGADALRGTVLRAPPIDDPDALWTHELIGAVVVSQTGDILGRVDAVESNPASDLLVLDNGGLIPLRFVTDHQGDRVTVDIPPGLLDL
jgi:16S rRNA processing protein RimM